MTDHPLSFENGPVFAATSLGSPGAGFPWNEVNPVLEGLVKPSAETELLQDHTPVTPSSYSCHT